MSGLKLLVRADVWDRDYKPIIVDDRLGEAVMKQAGNFYTDEEWEKKREKVLKLKLP